MSRSQPYRSKMPVEILRTLDVASRITLFLVGQSGPLSFTFKDRLDSKYKTSIGSDIKCSCSPNKNDHCIHSLYILLRIFKLSPDNPVIWQAAYVDSELNDLLSGKYTVQQKRRLIRPIFDQNYQSYHSQLPSDFISQKKRSKAYSFPQQKAERLQINDESVCPICQDQMKEDQNLTYCKTKCGNNFHLQCLKVWVEHKTSTNQKITCPMCRTSFSENLLGNLIEEDKIYKKQNAKKAKLVFKCSGCGVLQIPNIAYKCLLCTSFQLCQACYKSNKHIKHPFIRQFESDPARWCGGQERREQQLKMKKYIDNKRKQKNVNEQLIQKLRKNLEDPNKLLDFIASSYPYVSKYISDNIDTNKKLDLNQEEMKCMKCFSKRMIFLRRLTCGHFVDHECLKQKVKNQKLYCQICGVKIIKGYQDLIQRQKKLEKEQYIYNGSEQFNPSHMQKKQQSYNFVLPEQATLLDVLGGRIRSPQSQIKQEDSRLRQRLAHNLVRGAEVINRFRNNQEIQLVQHIERSHHNNHISNKESERARKNQIRLQSINKPIEEQERKFRSTSRKAVNKKYKEDFGLMVQGMIGRKIF